MGKYRGVLLDADNTLFDYDRAESEALDETLSEVAPRVPRARAVESYRQINARYWKRFEAGEVDAAGLQSGRWNDLFVTLGLDGDPSRAASGYVAALSRQVHLLPGTAEAVRALSARARLCLVTNGLSMVQRGRLARSGLAGFFSSIVISEEIGSAKPDARFFQAAVRSLGLAPADLLCVGDNPVADVEGARRAGIDAWWFSPNGASWPGPGEQPRVLKELAEILPALHGP
ncbi:MAG TPA: YjjG family noncanonical pyrimidine nucleotidase [Spirochaetia bacterium]|nr:YjjG family noncanonical pyrimidine nucleotidase [Spirochaetia bacterium]